MATFTRTDIANLALRLLGIDRLEDIEEDESTVADAVRDTFDLTLEKVLGKHTWLCTRKLVELAEADPAPVFGKAHRYEVPEDFLRLDDLDQEGNKITRDWEIRERSIHTDEGAPLQVAYIARIADPSAWDPALRVVFSYELALALVEALTNSNTKKQLLQTQLKVEIEEARHTNAIQRIPRRRMAGRWIEVRR